jgi:hypothetical protein
MAETEFDISFDLSNPQQTDISLVLLPQTNSESANYYKFIVNKECDGPIWYSHEKLQGFQEDLQRASQFLLTESTKSIPNTKQILFDPQDGLATIGNNVYISLLQGEALACLKAALEEIDEGQIPTIHIFAKDFVIQWEWL